MIDSVDARRRWLGGIFLAAATGMLILGLTVFKNRLQARAFVYYWLICTAFTGLTMIVALLDLRAVRIRSRREERELVKTVLREFADDAGESLEDSDS